MDRMNKDQLLKILDMCENKQWKWLIKNIFKISWDGKYTHFYYQNEEILSLADLAFRLRDEDKYNFVFGLVEVWQHLKNEMGTPSPGEMIRDSKPIHWIIAALIAKAEK